MALEVKRKRVEVDLILDQEKAERISQLGEQLARAGASHVTEGANAAAKRIARQIDELREEVSGQIVHLTLEALPLSQWRQVLEANTTTTKDGRTAQRLEDITRRRAQADDPQERAGHPRRGYSRHHPRTVRRAAVARLVRHPEPQREDDRPKRLPRPSLQDNPGLVRELRICARLGISYKRWLGWEPSYRVERDGHRRITGYTPESEWDQTERDWMLALDDYEHSLCPRCGMPVSVCHDELTPTRYTAEAGVCQISLMRDIAAEDWRKQHDGEAGIKTMSLTTAIKAR